MMNVRKNAVAMQNGVPASEWHNPEYDGTLAVVLKRTHDMVELNDGGRFYIRLHISVFLTYYEVIGRL